MADDRAQETKRLVGLPEVWSILDQTVPLLLHEDGNPQKVADDIQRVAYLCPLVCGLPPVKRPVRGARRRVM